MVERHLERIVADPTIGRQMRFIAGPRQAGKTTLAQRILAMNRSEDLYFNWDLREVRDKFKADFGFFETPLRDARSQGHFPWVCFDEIHKMPRWKDILKSYFDKHEAEARFLVTGSARLDWFRRSGDSLAGRYFLFRLNPLTLSEAAGSLLAEPAPSESAHEFMGKKAGRVRYEEEALSQLLNYSGFPEPFLKADAPFYRRWQRDMVDRLTREDVRDLTRILDVEHVATLMQILPDRIGSPLSLNALREDIGIGYSAVRSAISALQLTYAFFLISPYSRNIARTVKKEKKGYFFDWGRCTDPAKRFENYVGCELKALTDLWHDKGIGDFSLMYVRSRDGKETDFLVTRNNEPWCLFEAKIEDGSIPSHHFHHAQALGDIPLIQVVQNGRVFRKEERAAYRISASRFFA
jgi:hypothetical protein